MQKVLSSELVSAFIQNSKKKSYFKPSMQQGGFSSTGVDTMTAQRTLLCDRRDTTLFAGDKDMKLGTSEDENEKAPWSSYNAKHVKETKTPMTL